jgi:hypothetical protein
MQNDCDQLKQWDSTRQRHVLAPGIRRTVAAVVEPKSTALEACNEEMKMKASPQLQKSV